MRDITIDSCGRRLAARQFAPPGSPSGAAILFIHGAGSDQSGYRLSAEAASERLGASCLTFDLSGHGGSDGDAQTLLPRDHLRDCLAVFDALLGSEEVDPGRAGLCGASYGGFLASLLTALRRVRSLLLPAPALYPDRDLTALARRCARAFRRLTRAPRCARCSSSIVQFWFSSPSTTRQSATM
jgi:uncharacterized protein